MTLDQEALSMVKLAVLRPWLFGHRCLVECPEDTKNDELWAGWLGQSGLLRGCCATARGSGVIDEDFETISLVNHVLEGMLRTTREPEDETQMEHLYERLENLEGQRTDYGMVVSICQKYPYTRKWKELWRGGSKWARVAEEMTNLDEIGAELEHFARDQVFVLIAFTCCKYALVKRLIAKKGIQCFRDALLETKVVEVLRYRGNEEYKKKLYSKAINLYSAALKQAPYQYKLYSNRAQAYLNVGNNHEAASDGLRCVTINPRWDKGWQRYAQGLYNMGMKELALKVNAAGRWFFPLDPLLNSQEKRFRLEFDDMDIPQIKETVAPVKKTKTKKKKANVEKVPLDVPPLVSTDEEEDDLTAIKEKRKDEELQATALLLQKSQIEREAEDRKVRGIEQEYRDELAHTLNPVSMKLKVEEKLKEQQEKVRAKERRKEEEEVRKREERRIDGERKREKARETVRVMPNLNTGNTAETTDIRNLLKEGSEALIDVRTRNAIHCYERALMKMKPKILSAMRYQDVDVALVKYSLGVACVDVGSEKEVDAGLKQFNEILDLSTLKFPLAWLGIGMAYNRWNRFSDALVALQKGLRIELKIHFGVHTWPETTTCIEQTRPGKLKEAFEKQLWVSRHPPRPDAVCRFASCNAHYKVQIYFTDPDFKGFVRIGCYAKCTIEYHPDCWKKFKTDSKLSDKDILVSRCFTPDCASTCKLIEVIDHNGEIPRRLDGNPPVRPEMPPKSVRKMAPSSQYTINRRRERKQHRKECRLQAAKTKKDEENIKILQDLEAAARKKEEAPAAAVPPSVDHCVVLMKKEDEGDTSKVGKYKKKKRLREKSGKEVMTLEEFQERTAQENGYAGGLEDYEEYLLDDFDEYSSAIYPQLDATNPFSIPQNIQNEVRQFEAEQTGGATYGSPVTKEPPASYAAVAAEPDGAESTNIVNDDEDEQQRRAVKESLFTLFREILREHGPLHIEDERIASVLEGFPADTMKVVQDIGGIGRFLIQSLNFAMVDEVVSLMKDAAKARKVANKRKMMLRKTEGSSRHKMSRVGSASETSLTASVVSSKNIQSLDDRGSQGSENGISNPIKNSYILPGQKLYEGIGARDNDSESVATSGSEFADARSETGKYASNGFNQGIGASRESGRSQSESEVSQKDFGVGLWGGSSGVELSGSNRGSPVSLHKSSPWQVPVDPSANGDGLQMDSEEILNCFRLSANRLVSAVELGKLAVRMQIILSVEIHFMEGWRMEDGLEAADTATREEALAVLQDAINTVHTNSVHNYNTLGADIYFFGTGGSSGEDWSTWVKSPEVSCNRRIVIAMCLEDVDLSTVDFNELDHTTAETLMAIKKAVTVIKSTTDRFRGSDNIHKAVEPILSVIGRRVAADHPETKALLNYKRGKLPAGLSLSTSGVRSPVRVPSPIARPSSSVSSSPLPSTPTRPLNSPVTRSTSSSSSPLSFPFTWPPALNLASTLWAASKTHQPDNAGIDNFGYQVAAQGAGSSGCDHQGAAGSLEDSQSVAGKIETLQAEVERVRNDRDVLQIQVNDLQHQVQTLQKEKAMLKQEGNQWEQSCAKLSEENGAYAWQCNELSQQVSLTVAASEHSLAELHQQLQMERWQNEQLLNDKKGMLVAQEVQSKTNDLRVADEVMRAENAEKALLRLTLEFGLQILDRSQKEAESQILRIQQQRGVYRDNQLTIPKELSVAIDMWQTTLEKIKEVKATATAEFEGQMLEISNGERLENLPHLTVPCPPPVPEIPSLQVGGVPVPTGFFNTSSSTSSSSSNSLGGTTEGSTLATPSGGSKPKTAAAAVASGVSNAPPGFVSAPSSARAKTVSRPPGLGVGGSPASSNAGKTRNSFQKIIEVLLPRYPDFTSGDISTYFQELRRTRGSLSGMSMMDVRDYIENSIIKERRQRLVSESRMASAWSVVGNGVAATPAGGSWRGAALGGRVPPGDVFMEEEVDPCTICLEELPQHPMTQLDCRHRFHDHCIRKWLTEKSTCPICTQHTLLIDEFPALS